MKDEEIDAFPINFCEITEPEENNIFNPETVKYDPVIELRDCEVKIERFNKTSNVKKEDSRKETQKYRKEDESDFEWELDESIKQNWEVAKKKNEEKTLREEIKVLEVKTKRRKIESNSDETDDASLTAEERKQKAQTYVRYIRQCDLTPEILESKQKFVMIDGIEYKVPRRPLKSWMETKQKKVDKEPQSVNKRPHRSHDPEGEEKIRNFVEVKCHICDEKFDAFWRIRKHFKRFHPDEKGYLICCNRKFTRRYALLDHIEWHDRSKVHCCETCGKEYKTKKILQQHVNIVHLKLVPNYEFMCTQCGKIFKTSSALNTHINVMHKEGDGRTFECFVCHRESFKNEYTLQRHMKYLHDPDSPKYKTTICHICSAILKVVSMKHHMQAKHSNEIKEKVKCEICEHWIVKTSMKQHMEKHKNNTGAECDVCGKFFKSKLSVYKHKTIVHSTNYKFQCSYCDKKFHREVKMKEHIAVRHTRDFPFKCRVDGCGREFRAEANWKIHEKKAHPEEYDKYFKPHYLRSPTHPFPEDFSSNNVDFPQNLQALNL